MNNHKVFKECVYRYIMEIPIEKMDGKKRDPIIQVSANVKSKIWNLAKDKGIGWSDALEMGILFLVADKDGIDYPKSNLLDKMQKIARNFQAKAQECEALRDQLEGKIDPNIDKELNEVFKEVDDGKSE